MSNNSNLLKANKAKKDEFYTRYEDIEKELINYNKSNFENKIIYCPCDMPTSNFVKYFENNKDRLGYQRLIHTSIQEGYDFRLKECEKYFEEADIVVTNPPFSLFRDFVACLEKHNLKYIIVGHQNAITYKEIFSLICANKLWLGVGFKGNVGFFASPYKDIATASEHREGQIRVSGAAWFTNVDFDKRHELLLLSKIYNDTDYPIYDNYKAINVDKTKDIPCDYYEIMGVPITFLYQYNPDQFEILGMTASWCETELMQTIKTSDKKRHGPIINGKEIYRRILIRRRVNK